jgi:hypothetical protein
MVNNLITDETRIISLPKILDDRGNLTFIEGGIQIPFEIKRAYWIYDVPGGGIRGGHAYKLLQEFIVALSGSFDVILDDAKGKKTFTLNRSYYGLYVPKLLWRSLENFSTNALCMILSSNTYSESDYIRNYDDFLKLKC